LYRLGREKKQTKDEPYERVLIQQSKVEYKKGKDLFLEKPELTDELLPKNYFLFQKLKLNKDILKKLEVEDKSYSFETGSYNIKYLFTNEEIDNYLGINKQKVSFDINGEYSEIDKILPTGGKKAAQTKEVIQQNSDSYNKNIKIKKSSHDGSIFLCDIC